MQYIHPGTVLAVTVGTVEHVGIVTDQTQDGFPTVISNSQRRVPVLFVRRVAFSNIN